MLVNSGVSHLEGKVDSKSVGGTLATSHRDLGRRNSLKGNNVIEIKVVACPKSQQSEREKSYDGFNESR